MPRDTPAQASREGAPAASQPQTIGPTVGATAPLNQAAVLERIHHPDHGRSIQAHGFRKPALCDARVGLDQEQDADSPRGELSHACGEIAENRLLREAQPVTDQFRQDSGLQFTARALHFFFGFEGWGASYTE